MFKLFKYFKGYTLQAVSAPLFKIIEAIFELMLPFVVASVIDKGIPLGQQGDYSHIIKMCLVMVLLAAVGLASTLTAQYFSAKAAVGLTTNIRRALFSHIQSLGFSELDKLGTSTLITRITNDLNQVQTGVNWVLRLLMRSPVIVFGAAIMAFSIDTKSALVFVVIIPLLSLVVFGVMLATIPLHTAVQRRLDKVLLKTKENLVGARVIRAFCKEEGETKEFLEENGALAKAQKVVGRISSITNPLTFIIINFGIIALIYTGALRVESGILSQGMIIALYNYMSQILIELVKLANLIVSTTKAVACGNRIQSVFEINPSLQNGNATNGNDTETAVEFKDVSFAYQGSGENSLENISFALKKGEKLGVIGSTGCGKTTLANLIPRFYDATKGEVLVDGVNVKNYDFEALRHKIGFVMQKNRLFKGSLRENIAWGKLDATDSEILEALKLAQGENILENGGLEKDIEQNGRNLSGGQQQRLCIARALVRKPEILVLDDSSSALDYATEANLRQAIFSLEYDPAIVIVSQRVSSVMHCDKILVLEDGIMQGLGTHTELLDTCPEYAEIYKSQIKAQ